MTRHLRILLASAALVVWVGSGQPARAQLDVNLPVPSVQQLGLLLIPGIQKELKLDEGQVAQIKALAGKTQEFMVATIQGLQKSEISDRVLKVEAMNKSLAEDTKAQLGTILKEEQRSRLLQISLQERAAVAFVDPEVQDALKMSLNQRARIKSQVNELFLKARGIAIANPTDRAGMVAKTAALRKQTAQTILAEMSEEQRVAWKALIGTPIEIRYEVAPAPTQSPKPAAPAGGVTRP